MAYKTIFGLKPKKENKKEFCKRIVSLLDSIRFCGDGYVYNDGRKMLNIMFKYSELNNGYVSIEDLLNEADVPYASIFDLAEMDRFSIVEEEILVNIDLVINCLGGFKRADDRYFYSQSKAIETINIIFKAIEEYLLEIGYKIVSVDDRFNIVESGIAIDINEIDDSKIKNEVVTFYDYKNENDLDEKKKIILNVVGKIESKKNIIADVFGKNIADTISSYANNINLRHDNSDVSYKKYYNKAVADMNNEELLEWYNYIFAFVINIYIKLDNLKDINVNGGYK